MHLNAEVYDAGPMAMRYLRCSNWQASTSLRPIAEIEPFLNRHNRRDYISIRNTQPVIIGHSTAVIMPRALTLQQIEGAKPGKVYYPLEQLPPHVKSQLLIEHTDFKLNKYQSQPQAPMRSLSTSLRRHLTTVIFLCAVISILPFPSPTQF